MRWHRRVGIAAALLVVLAASTGVLINHADALGLARRHVHAAWLLHLYGIEPPRCTVSFALEGHALSACGGRLFVDQHALALPELDALVGAEAATPAAWLLAGRHQALLLTPAGVFIDRLPYPHGLEAQRVGRDGERLVVEGSDGRIWTPDAELTGWLQATHAPSSWQAAQPVPERWRVAIESASHAPGPSVERVLLDVHAGRWLGAAGPWLMDGAALALLLLAGSGLWTAWSRSRPPRSPRAARR
jgi:hypothetical protein